MTKVAILIDGGLFLKRLRQLRPDVGMTDAAAAKDLLFQLVNSHLKAIDQVERAPTGVPCCIACSIMVPCPTRGRSTGPSTAGLSTLPSFR